MPFRLEWFIPIEELRMGSNARSRTGQLAVGKPLPDVTVASTGNPSLRLSTFKGNPLVLYFYPRDDTPGCTLEGQTFRDRYGQFKALGAEVVGISRDSLASHEKFKSKHELPFELISDSDETLCRLFGVIDKKTLYGRTYLEIDRSTFVFDRDGTLRAEFRGVKVSGHVDRVLEEIANL
jgi:peroxiredoxin Q/BCP